MSQSKSPNGTQPPAADSVNLRYQTVRSSSMTFEAEKIREWVKNQIPSGATVLNACAGETKLELPDATVIRNDINPDRPADMHVDVREIADHLESDSVDVVIHDPPYSEQQSASKYCTGETTLYGEETLSEFRDVLKHGGLLIQFAYSPILNQQFELEAVCLWNRIGRGHDYISTVQRYQSTTLQGFPTVDTTASTRFNPRVAGVSGGSNFGGNNGADIEMSIRGSDGVSPTDQALDEAARLKQGVTVVVTDRPDRVCSTIDGRDTAILSVDADVSGTNHVGVRNLSDQLPAGIVDTVVIDVATAAYCWNTYYDPEKPWEETTEQTGYVRALKLEATKLLGDSGRLIQIGQTATNAPSGTEYERTHVALTATTEGTIAPFVVVDERSSTATSEPLSTDDKLWPTPRWTRERTRPSGFQYESDTEVIHHHPAIGVQCVACGAVQGCGCVANDETPLPDGMFHDDRIEQGNQRFYRSDTTLLPIHEYLRETWNQSVETDPARPKTAGGTTEKPPAVESEQQEQQEQQATLALFS